MSYDSCKKVARLGSPGWVGSKAMARGGGGGDGGRGGGGGLGSHNSDMPGEGEAV